MTLDEFLQLFREHAGKKRWVIKNETYLRSSDDECPICFLDNQINHNGKIDSDFEYWKTTFFILMDGMDSGEIVIAADGLHQTTIRDKLLEICKPC